MNTAIVSPITSTTRSARDSRPIPRRVNDVAKRALDIAAAAIGLILLAPWFLWIGWRIRRDSPGPALYRGWRVGKNGRRFQILKFRTMKECPESYRGTKVTGKDDPRITPLGRRLRDTKVNELPQLWNVLTGDMSLVGPRPEDPDIVATWPEPLRHEVLAVRPGITSPASVLYRDEETLLKSGNVMRTYLQSVLPSKLRLDQLYVRHRSFWLDLDVLFWTMFILLPMLRSFAPKEDLLFLGPISRFAGRYLNWFVVDTLVTFAAIGIAGLAWRLAGPLDVGWLPATLVGFGFALLFSLTGALLGMNRIAWSHAGTSEVFGLLLSTALAGAMAYLANSKWTEPPRLPPGLIVIASALALAGFVLVRYRSRLASAVAGRWLSRMGGALGARECVLIVGSGYTGQFIAWLLSNGSSVGVFHVVGFVDDDLYKQGLRYHGIGVIGRRSDIRPLVEKHDVGIIVFAIHNIQPAERERVLAICHSTAARVVMVPDIVGALNAVVTEHTHAPSVAQAAPPEPVAEETVAFAAPGVSPLQAELWLADLECAAKAGDLAAVSDRIRMMREGLQRLGG